MKQVERRSEKGVVIYCKPTFKEKLRIIFSKKFKIVVDYSNTTESGAGIISYPELKTF